MLLPCAATVGVAASRVHFVHFEIREYIREFKVSTRAGGRSCKCCSSCCRRFELHELLMDFLLLAAAAAAPALGGPSVAFSRKKFKYFAKFATYERNTT